MILMTFKSPLIYLASAFIILVTSISIPYAPVHAFAENVTVTQTTGIAVSPYIWGVNYEGYSLYTSAAEFLASMDAAKLAELGPTIMRFPGGCIADVYDWETSRIHFIKPDGTTADRTILSVEDAFTVAGQINGDLIYQINIDDGSVTNYCGAKSLEPGTVAKAQKLINTYKGRIHHIELGNEQWINWDPVKYATLAVQYAKAIKAIDPTIKIGLIGFGSGQVNLQARNTAWTAMIKQLFASVCSTGPCFDYVADHPYATITHNPPFNGQNAYYPITNYGPLLQQLTADYAPKKYIATEWNLPCWGTPPGNTATNTVEHGMFVFSMLMEMAKNKVYMANYHDFTSTDWLSAGNGCSLFQGTSQFTPAGSAFSLSSVAAGGTMYDTIAAGPSLTIPPDNACTNGTGCIAAAAAPYMSAYGVKQGNSLLVYLVNRHESETANTNITLSGFFNSGPKQVAISKLKATAYTDAAFVQANEIETSSGILAVNIEPLTIARLTFINQFAGAPATNTPAPTRTAANVTIPYPDAEPEEPQEMSIIMYIIASAVYIMLIHFAIAITKEFKIFLMVSLFVLGGVIGLFMHSLQAGFILSVILTLFLW